MTDHVVQLRYYNDGAENPVAWRDLDGGRPGAFLQPLVARRLGQARHRVWEVRDTSPFAMDILAAAVLTDLQPVEIPFPLPDGTYRDATRPWTHQDVVNWLPCFAEAGGTRSALKYATAPGLTTFANVGDGPHRGICDAEGVLYVVSGSVLYRVAPNGDSTSLGTIPGTGRVAMTYNQITGGHQLVVANGSSGYVYDSYADTLTQITDDGFVGFTDCDFLNQYIVGVEPQGRFWYHSELNDALSYNTLDRYPAETSPDPIVGLRASHNEVLVFGARTIEPWVNDVENNAAATAFQLERGSVVERGCAAGATIRRLDNSIFFLGDDGMPYRLDGYTPRPIAPQALVSAWKDCELERAFAFTFEDNGHVVYYLTFPDGQTWGYDVAASAVAGHPVWHRRQSFGLDRWRLNTLAKSNGVWYGGDYQNGKLYRLEWGNVYEGCELMPRSFKSGVLHNNGLPVTISAFRLTAATGAPRSVPHGVATTTGSTLSLSGDLGDGSTGYPVSYAYTLTTTYPGQGYTLAIVSGALPDGVSMSAGGVFSGTRTTVGNYTWVVELRNSSGAPVLQLRDYSNTWAHDAFNPEISAVKYKVVAPDDTADYSDPAYDDSSWATGVAPFGNADNAAAAGVGFQLSPVTNWPLGQKLWYRAHVTLSSTADLTADIFADDVGAAWANGTQYYYHSSGGASGIGAWYTAGVTVPAANLVVGDNVLVFQSTEVYGGQSYFDYRLHQPTYTPPDTPASPAAVVTILDGDPTC